jgi:hypothetical protein
MALCAAERSKDAANKSRWLRVAALLAAVVIPPAAGAAVDNNAPQNVISRVLNANYRKYRRAVFRSLGLDPRQQWA